MASFAEIAEGTNAAGEPAWIVQRVLAVQDAEEHRGQEHLADELGLGGIWIQTSYNTHGGVHYNPPDEETGISDWLPSGKDHVRYNYCSAGHIYDPVADAFYEDATGHDDWILNTETYVWERIEDAARDD